MASRRLGERLIEAGAIGEEHLQIALAEQARTGCRLGELLIELGFAGAEDVARTVADVAGARFLPLDGLEPEADLAELVDCEFARKKQLVPVLREGRLLTVAMVDPVDIVTIDKLRDLSGLDIEVAVATLPDVVAAQSVLYGDEGRGPDLDERIDAARKAVAEGDLGGDSELAPVVGLVDEIIRESLRRRATDIHIEPEERVVRVRFRVDGVLVNGPTLTRDLKSSVTARIKILSDLDIGETRLPQDGRIRVHVETRTIDLRVSTMPTVHGENLVLRVLDKSNLVKGLGALGMIERDLDALEGLLATLAGMILVTGPTSSGKTTTLYSALASLDASRHKVATLEDPVEYELPLIRQSQVHEKAGFGFAEGLRALLRQDPDIVFVGEMRDPETAGIAVRAALTGHLVLSTLHTTSALVTINRLEQMGIPLDLIVSSVRGILAQRLVRVICKGCSAPASPDVTLLRRLEVDDAEAVNWQAGTGCEQCTGTGYLGRAGLYEMVRFSPALSNAVSLGRPLAELANIVALDGTRFLRQDGMEKARQGVTTLGEVLKATADAPIPQGANKNEALTHA